MAKPKYPKRFYFKHSAYYFVDKTNVWHRLGTDYFEALQLYAKYNLDPPVKLSMSAIFDRYERDILPTQAPRTQVNRRSSLRFLRHAFGHMHPADITPPDIYAYMDARKAKVAANRDKSVLSNIFNFAIRWGLTADNPCRNVARFKENPRDRYVTDEEFWRVYDTASTIVQRAMHIAVVTGLRLGDILALRADTHCTAEGLLIRPAKTLHSSRRVLLFRWTAGLCDALGVSADAPSAGPPGFLVSGEKPLNPIAFHKRWKRALRAAGIDESSHFTFHDLRAKAGSDSADGKLLGHTDRKTLERHYRRRPAEVEPVTLPSGRRADS